MSTEHTPEQYTASLDRGLDLMKRQLEAGDSAGWGQTFSRWEGLLRRYERAEDARREKERQEVTR